jgi:acyl carrier protein
MLEEVRTVLGHTLKLGNRAMKLTESSPLLGAVPELDSMAVVYVIVALQDHFNISVEDDEIGASTFATLGSLTRFVQDKRRAA